MCRRKYAYVMKLLTTVLILLALEVSSQTVDETVEYKDVLKSRVGEIQTDITQVNSDRIYKFQCDHYPVYTGDSIKIVIFVWTSEAETHDMVTCLYQGIKRIRTQIIRMLQSPNQSLTFLSAKFCNRSLTSVIFSSGAFSGQEIDNKTTVIALSFYAIEPQTGGLVEETTPMHIYMWYIHKSGIPTITSSIGARPLRNIGSHVRTLVCNSIQVTMNETGKLQQRFFSVVETSLAETTIKSIRFGYVNVPLYFDVLALNASRLGLLNGSHVELLSLSDLQVSCIKRDQYGLDTETNEVVHVDTTKELLVTTKALIIDEKLRVFVSAFIPVVSDNSFGTYTCLTSCKLQTKNSNFTTNGCSQRKHFSIVSKDWRDENLALIQDNQYCENYINYIETLHTSAAKWAEYVKILTEKLKDEFKKVTSLQFLVDSLALTLIIAGVTIIIIIYKELKTRSNLNAFISMQAMLRSTENTNDRIIKYDVFLSYSSKDRPWVESTLLTFIESKRFKVCFDERDFLLGCNLVQTISTAVYESRRVIAVVSPNYLQSRWCAEYEFVLTYTKILNKEASSNSLLLIKYKDCQMPTHMRCLKYLDYTKTTTACDDNRSVFMKMLSYILPLYPQIDACETSTEKQFFEDLTSWLEQPDIDEAY